jgi:hypothetical protein
MTTIDYAAQFMAIDYLTAGSVSRGFKNHRTYSDPKAAYVSAKRSEDRGSSVAFAVTSDGVYHVWTVEIDDDEITAMTEVGEEAIAEMVAVKCVACERVVTDRDVMARMWCVDTCCPFCGDGALLWDDGSLGFADEIKTIAMGLVTHYDTLVADLESLVRMEARDKYIAEREQSIGEMAPVLAEALRSLLA